LQPELVTPESHVGIYCEFEELVFPVSFHVLGMCKGEVMFEKDVTVLENGDDADVCVRKDGFGAVFKIREEKDCEPDFMRVTYEAGGKTETFETESTVFVYRPEAITPCIPMITPTESVLWNAGAGISLQTGMRSLI